VGSDHLGLLFDVGNGVSYGYDSVDFLTPVLAHVRHVHVKDSAVVDGRVVFAPPGTGRSRVEECVRLLEQAGYRGLYSIEPHLHLVPHEARTGDPAVMADAYLEYGRAAQGLLRAAGVREAADADA
jgi:sugar phosphate isomerase/epimerase